jgi:hypothetical protein
MLPVLGPVGRPSLRCIRGGGSGFARLHLRSAIAVDSACQGNSGLPTSGFRSVASPGGDPVAARSIQLLVRCCPAITVTATGSETLSERSETAALLRRYFVAWHVGAQ